MLAVGRSRLAASSGLSLPKLSAIVARAIARSGPLSSGAANALASQATFAPFMKANLPVLTNLVLREYATAAKKKTTTKKKATAKKTTAKKPAAKRRTVAKKTGTRRAATKKKPAAKKKKPAPKKKKVVRKKAAAKKPGIKAQYGKALTNAPSKTVSGYTLFFTDSVKALGKGIRLAERAKEIGAQWRALSDAEKQVWNDRSAEETVKRKAAYAQWLAKQNPADIEAANNARNRIRAYRQKKGIRGSTSHTKIKDDRLVKRPITAWIFFVKNNFHRPELEAFEKGKKFTKLAELWKAASDAEKKKYNDLAAKDTVRYQAEKADFAKKYKN
ncbi:hypothetical protein TWF281_008139 [Arthrobotrys megalospora]